MRNIFIVGILLLVSGCSSLGQLPEGASYDQGSNDVIYIIGSEPEDLRLSIFHGSIKKDEFVPNLIWNTIANYYGAPQDGYIIGRAKAGDKLAILNMKTSTFSANYGPCEGVKTLAFSLPNPGVYYITDVKYQYNGNGFTMTNADDFDKAKEFIKKHYSSLYSLVTPAKYKLLPVNRSCTTNITVVVPR